MALRQAVVIVHGIGEQKPMDTLRGFAEAILDRPADERPKFWSRPDAMSESFELRKLTSAESGQRPRTDFYEYYWAYLMEGTGIRHVLAWFRMLLFRRPKNVPRRLRLVWTVTWLLLVAAAAFGASAGFLPGSTSPALKTTSFWLSTASTLLLGAVHGVLLYYIGDAARYLNPAPGNISVRHEIRKNGVDLLRKLHDAGRYDRIILVGHSLGSVVGYDILKHFWAERHQMQAPPDPAALKALEDAAAALGPAPADAALNEFQRAQREFWIRQRSLGHPWKISDFVTAGSPLSHAILLLAGDADDLRARTSERELPTCPPAIEGGPSTGFTYTWSGRTHLHHAAHFAPTRWTNLYFRGDIIGGPMDILGRGVVDRKLVKPAWSVCPTSHTRYWKYVGKDGQNVPGFIQTLRDAVGLDCSAWLSRVNAPPSPAVPLPDRDPVQT